MTGISVPAQDVCHAPPHSTSLCECGAGRGWRRPALGGSPVGVVQAAGLRGRVCVPPRGRSRSVCFQAKEESVWEKAARGYRGAVRVTAAFR